MLSKEEIEKLLSCDNCKLKECIGCDITYTERNKIREYIEQLETDKQELIEKLEKDISEYPEARYTKYYICDILKILKGENT